MKQLIFLVITGLLFSCATKKEKAVSYKSCNEYFNDLITKQTKPSKNFKVYCTVHYEGKTLLMKGKFNKYGGGTIKFYLPIGAKVATVEKKGEEFCLVEGKDCKRISNPFRKIGISVEKVLTQNFRINQTDSYHCSKDSLIITRPGYSLVYKNGKLKSVLMRNLLITYKSEKEIYIYDMGKPLAKFEIRKIIYER